MSWSDEARWYDRSGAAVAAGCLSFLFAVLLVAAPATAMTDLVFFDQITGYGFDQSVYGLNVDVTADNYQVAADESLNGYPDANGDPTELFMFIDQDIDGAWIEDCAGADPSCVQRALIDITWNVELNPDSPSVGDDPLRVVLFLASPDRDPRFAGIGVGVLYDAPEFEVVRYPSQDGQGNPYDYHFLGFDLGPLQPDVPTALPGIPTAATVNFQYELVGTLYTDPATGAPLGPGIGAGASIIGVPEPSTAVLALLGLSGLAMLGRNRPRETHLT